MSEVETSTSAEDQSIVEEPDTQLQESAQAAESMAGNETATAAPEGRPAVAESPCPTLTDTPLAAGEQPSMDQLLGDESCMPPRRGEIRRGVVLSVSPTQVVLDIRAKREGFVPQRELEHLDRQVREQITVGAEIPVYVVTPEDEEGRTIVSISRGLVQADWDLAQSLLESQQLWEGRAIGYNRGGLLVEFGQLRGFIPTSHLVGFPRSIALEERPKQLSEMVGRRLGLRVIEVDQQRNRLVLSERAAYREWREQQQAHLLEQIQEAAIVHGRVTSIQDFGVFVDLDGLEGLIHISELSWTRVDHPGKILQVGDEVDVRVLRVDRERKRISLSLRQAGGDPWEHIEERYTLGQLISGRVTRIVSYGVFVEVEEGIEGLVHISELADEKPANPRDIVEEGEVLPLRVIRIDSTRRRLGLSFRRVSQAEWEEWRASRLHTEEPARAEETAQEKEARAEEEAAVATDEEVPGAEEKAAATVAEERPAEVEATVAAAEERPAEVEATVAAAEERPAEVEATVAAAEERPAAEEGTAGRRRRKSAHRREEPAEET